MMLNVITNENITSIGKTMQSKLKVGDPHGAQPKNSHQQLKDSIITLIYNYYVRWLNVSVMAKVAETRLCWTTVENISNL